MGRSEKDTATRKFTDMDAAALRASMGRFEGVCVVATVNPDGTPDAAIFAPAMPDDEHVILMLADNHTRANIERTGVARLVYDVANPTAEDKAARHAGARLDLALVRPEGETAEEHRRVAEGFPRMNPAVMILRIERIPFDTIVQRIMDGEITDAKTVATVLKTKVRLHL